MKLGFNGGTRRHFSPHTLVSSSSCLFLRSSVYLLASSNVWGFGAVEFTNGNLLLEECVNKYSFFRVEDAVRTVSVYGR